MKGIREISVKRDRSDGIVKKICCWNVEILDLDAGRGKRASGTGRD